MDEEIRERLDEQKYREAFELLMPQYQNKVFRLAYSMLGNVALAEETAQDIFIRIWKALAGYRGQASLSTWIYSIARNTCLSALRTNAAKVASLDEARVRFRVEASQHQTVSGERGIDWQQMLAEVPDKYRQALVLFYMEDKSYDEVARLLDLPMGTVKTYLHRARKSLAVAVMNSKISDGRR